MIYLCEVTSKQTLHNAKVIFMYYCSEVNSWQNLFQISVQISCTDLFMWSHLTPSIASNISVDIMYSFIYVKSPQTIHCFKYQCRYHVLICLCEVTSHHPLPQISVQILCTDLFMRSHLRPIIVSNISADIVYWCIYVKSPHTIHCLKYQCRYYVLIYLCEVTSDQSLLQISVQISCTDLFMWSHLRPIIASNISADIIYWFIYVKSPQTNHCFKYQCRYHVLIYLCEIT